MSGNIHDTDVNRLEQELESLREHVTAAMEGGASVSDPAFKTELQVRYRYTHQKFPTLFKKIIEMVDTGKTEHLESNIEMMLKLVRRIQHNQTSQFDASVIVGEALAKQYFPKDAR